MDTTNRSSSHRHQPAAGIPPAPPRLRSRSVTPATKSPSPKIHPSPTNRRSKSTTKSRPSPNQENFNPINSPITITEKKNPNQNREINGSFRKFWQGNEKKKVRPSPPRSPSAWALSPGRTSPVTQNSPGRTVSSTGVGGVLKYFRQRKVVGSKLEEVGYREFRVNYYRLLQWRFVNAKAEASMAAANMRAKKKVFNVWVRILLVRNSIMQQRIEMQKLKNEIKLNYIFNSQYPLLKECKRMEAKNSEAVGRVARKLSATSIRIPLLHGAKASVETMYDAMSTANMVLANIEAIIMRFHSQVENICYLLTELTVIGKQQKEYLEELDKRITMIDSLKAVEKNLRVQVLQLLKESRRIESP